MCLQRVQDLKDNLGNRLEPVDFVDSDNDTCDYIELTNNNTWTSDGKDFLILQLNIRSLLNKQHESDK